MSHDTDDDLCLVGLFVCGCLLERALPAVSVYYVTENTQRTREEQRKREDTANEHSRPRRGVKCTPIVSRRISLCRDRDRVRIRQCCNITLVAVMMMRRRRRGSGRNTGESERKRERERAAVTHAKREERHLHTSTALVRLAARRAKIRRHRGAHLPPPHASHGKGSARGGSAHA